MANKAAFALSVSKIVSTNNKSAPPSMSPRACSEYATTNSSNVVARNPGSFTLGDNESVRLVGPNAPATYLGVVSPDSF